LSLLPTIYLPSLIFYIGMGMLIPVLPLYAREFTAQYQLIGFALAANSIGLVIFDIPTGILLGRIGRKNSMLAGMLVSGLAIGLTFLSTNIWHVILLQFFSGFGIALFSVARHTYLADEVSVEARGVAISTIGGVFRGGNAVGPLLGGSVVAAYFGLASTFLAASVMMGIGVLLVYFFVPLDDLSTLDVAQKGHHGDIGSLLRDHGTVLLFAGSGAFFGQMVRVARRLVLPLFASEILGLDVQQIGFIVSVSSFVDMPLFPLAGYLMDQLGRKFAIVPSFALQGVGVLLIPFTTGFWTLIGVGILIGLANGISAGTMMTLGADLSPPDRRGEFLGIWRLIGDGGVMSAPLIVGRIADALTLGSATIVLSFSGFISAMIFLWFVPETLNKELVLEKQQA
ncbi:MAG: MFS transporter, partial [Chloroflexota bacterium]